MGKMRVSILAKELGVKSNILIETCREKGLTQIHHHANTLDAEQVEMLRQAFMGGDKAQKAVVPPVEKIPTGVTTTISDRPEISQAIEEAEKVLEGERKSKVLQPKKFIKIQKGIGRYKPERHGFVGERFKRGKGIPFAHKPEMPATKGYRPKQPETVVKEQKLQLELPVTVKNLSNKLGVKANNIIAKLLMGHNIRVTINQNLEKDVVELLGLDFGFEIEVRESKSLEDEIIFRKEEEKPENLRPRTPIVAFLGHVDHGKTSLLDSIRQTNVAGGEAGGITQHIGAYHVEAHGERIIFLDTPGHEAFTALRARGANVTDIVVLVVAADDGVMPQTEEALNHAKAANVPVVVAINKVDKPGANVLRVKQQLANLGLVAEEWGGKTQVVETSAVIKQGLDELIERLLLEAEMLDLKYNPDNPARGVILEAQIHAGKGIMATTLVRDGMLKLGDAIVCGRTTGRVRAIYTDRGGEVKKGGTETPLLVSDWADIPEAGDRFYVIEDLSKAREIALERQKKYRETGLTTYSHVTLDNLYSKIEEGKIKEIRIILKADFKGSVEVLKKTIEGLSIGEVKIRILHGGVGSITESDILLADASDAIVIGFCTSPDDKAKALADAKGVEVKLYKIVYDVTKDIKAAMEGMLEPEMQEHVLGQVEIRKVFKVSKVGNIAGCYVRSGKVTRNSLIRLSRDGVVLHSGKLDSLRVEKEHVKEVKAGFECGLKIVDYDDIRVGDTVEAYEIQKITRILR